MRARDVGLVVLGAGLGAGLAWGLLDGPRAGPASAGASEAARETAALRERIAALERELIARPAPLAAAPRAAPPSPSADAPRDGAGDPATPGVTPPGGPDGRDSDRRRPDGAVGTQDAPELRLDGPSWGQGRTFRLGAGGTLVPADAPPAPPLDPSDVRRLLDDGTDASLVRAAEELRRSGDRSFLADLVDRVNRPEHRAAAPNLIPTIASLKDRPWSALQATGAPDTPIDGDHGTAWASKSPEMGRVSLELTYDRPVRVDAVRIHETLAPGAVAKVEALGPDGVWETLWEGTSTARPSPSWFEPPLSPTRFAASRLRLTLDTDRVAGWNEIDAVELAGDGLRQWASGATASSSYPDP